MKILSFNCRGLGNPRTVRALYDIVKRKAPSLVFLMETKLHKHEMEKVKFKLGFANGLFYDANNRAGGLVLLWWSDVNVEILSYSGNHIDSQILDNGVAMWRFTGFDGCLEVSMRTMSWDLLVILHSHSALPWLCIGDFNEIVEAGEKWGRVPRAEWQMRNFRQAISRCNFRDLGFYGPKFTWCNNRLGEECVKERLDRALVSTDWDMLFPLARVETLVCSASDHLPILVDLDGVSVGAGKRKKLFRFEAMWVRFEECE